MQHSSPSTTDFQSLWKTPFLNTVVPEAAELNRGLAAIILEKETELINQAEPTEVAGLTGGLTAHWLQYNVLNWDYPECLVFRSIVLENIEELLTRLQPDLGICHTVCGISCWANVLRNGESLQIHHHDPAFFSAHYMVQSGNEEGDPQEESSGATVYFRPGFIERSLGGRQAGFTSIWDSDWKITKPPSEGHLTFFPSYVRHEVRPHRGRRERISIAMDIYVKAQNTPMFFSGPRWYVPNAR